MRGFSSIPSVVQIWLAQMVVLLFFADPVVRLVQAIFRPATGILKTNFDWFYVIPWTIGALCLYWLMRTIFRPRLEKVRWVPVFQAGPAAVWNSRAGVNYAFPSTHPSYVFMDALAAGLAFFIFWIWTTEWQVRRLEGAIFLALGLLTPVARLVAWYGLGLRPPPPAPGAEAAEFRAATLRNGWRPVFAFYAVFVPVIVLAGGLGWYYTVRDQRARIDSAQRIAPEDLASARFFEQIRDTAASQAQSKLARIQIAAADGAERCEHATVKSSVHFNLRTNFGSAGEMMIVVPLPEKEKLDKRLAAGGPADLIGILVRPPAPNAIPQWRQYVYCTLPRAARQPKWIFEVEQVLDAPKR